MRSTGSWRVSLTTRQVAVDDDGWRCRDGWLQSGGGPLVGRGIQRIAKKRKPSGFTAMVSAVLLRSRAHPGPPPSPDGACSISSATAVSNPRTACTNAPWPATVRRAARRTSYTTRRLSAEPVVPPPVRAPKVSMSCFPAVRRLSNPTSGYRPAGHRSIVQSGGTRFPVPASGAPGQACSTSNAARLRASLLNSTPIRWIGSPRSRYLSA